MNNNNKNVLYSLLVGLVFGFLIAGTLGISFFGSSNNNTDDGDVVAGELRKDAAKFKVAYNLDDSIYMPITGTEAYQKINDGDTFILYAGRDTCAFCQAYVPELMEAAENLGYTEIFYVDTVDVLNEMFVDDENVNQTPTTFLVKDGVIVEIVKGYQTASSIQTTIDDNLS